MSICLCVCASVCLCVPFLFWEMIYSNYLQESLYAVGRIKMPVSGISIFYNSSTYVDLYVGTDELRRAQLFLIHLWNISQNGVLSHAHFAITNNSICLKFDTISKYSLYLRLIESKIQTHNWKHRKLVCIATA